MIKVARKLDRCSDQRELAAGSSRRVLQLPRLIQRSLRQAAPGSGRPTLGDREDCYVVGGIIVALDVHLPDVGRLGHDRERLKRDVAFSQPGNVDVPTSPAIEQVSAPQQRIRMQIDDQQLLVKLDRSLGREIGRGIERNVQSLFKLGRHNKKERSEQQ